MPEQPDALDVFEQLRAAGDAAMPKLIERIQTVIDGGAKVTRAFQCSACGHRGNVEVEGADIKEHRQLVEMFAKLRLDAAKASKEGDMSAKARKLITDFTEMTSEALAEHIIGLEAEIAAA